MTRSWCRDRVGVLVGRRQYEQGAGGQCLETRFQERAAGVFGALGNKGAVRVRQEIVPGITGRRAMAIPRHTSTPVSSGPARCDTAESSAELARCFWQSGWHWMFDMDAARRSRPGRKLLRHGAAGEGY